MTAPFSGGVLAAAGPPATLIDHHCHGVVIEDLDEPGFEALISESSFPPAEGTSYFDSPLGLAVRRWCAPLLGLERHAPGVDYVARRAELGAAEVNRRLMHATGITHLLIDTGYTPATIATPAQMAEYSGARAVTVTRIETVAQQIAMTGAGAAEFTTAFVEELRRQAATSVGFKSIMAYRYGLDFNPAWPSDREALAAADEWFTEGSRDRVSHPVLLRWLLWQGVEAAREFGLPIQVHVGFGDPDIDLHRCNPLLMTSFIRAISGLGVPLMLLHCYPFEREAGYLAAMFPHVYFDVGSIVHYTAAESQRIIAHSLELAPFRKILFSTDAFGLPEHYVVGTELLRRGLDATLTSWVAAGDCSPEDARRIASQIYGGNAQLVYPGLAA